MMDREIGLFCLGFIIGVIIIVAAAALAHADVLYLQRRSGDVSISTGLTAAECSRIQRTIHAGARVTMHGVLVESPQDILNNECLP